MARGVALMWIFTDKGFLSIVQHNTLPDCFQVKSRVIDPLEILWPDHDVEVIDWADYRYRITIAKEEVVPVLVGAIESIGYTSFKGQCRDDASYYESLGRIWAEMYHYQTKMESS